MVKTVAANQEITDAEFGQLDAAHKAMTLYLVSQNEMIMESLTEMVNDPDFLGSTNLPRLS